MGCIKQAPTSQLTSPQLRHILHLVLLAHTPCSYFSHSDSSLYMSHLQAPPPLPSQSWRQLLQPWPPPRPSWSARHASHSALSSAVQQSPQQPAVQKRCGRQITAVQGLPNSISGCSATCCCHLCILQLPSSRFENQAGWSGFNRAIVNHAQ